MKHNALAGRQEELTRWENYAPLAVYWRDQVANVRLHDRTRERPVDRFEKERALLRALPAQTFDTDEVVPAGGQQTGPIRQLPAQWFDARGQAERRQVRADHVRTKQGFGFDRQGDSLRLTGGRFPAGL